MRSHLCRRNRRPDTRIPCARDAHLRMLLRVCVSARARITRRSNGENVSVAKHTARLGLNWDRISAGQARCFQQLLAHPPQIWPPVVSVWSGGAGRCHIRSLPRAPPRFDMMTAQRAPQLDVRGFRLEISGKKKKKGGKIAIKMFNCKCS